MPGSGSETGLLTRMALLVLASKQASDVTTGTSAKEAPLLAPCGLWAQSVSLPAISTCRPWLTSRSASTWLQPPPRGTCPWQEAASAELKTIRVDQRKCRVGWRAGQILISTCWPHASLHMSHPTELSGHAVWIRLLQARFAKLAQSSREAREEAGIWVRCGCPGAREEAVGSLGTQDSGSGRDCESCCLWPTSSAQLHEPH